MKNKKTFRRLAGKKQILSQMFDVRPVNKTGGLDWERICLVAETKAGGKPGRKSGTNTASGPAVTDIRKPDAITDEIKRFQKFITDETIKQADVFQLGERFKGGSVPVFYEIETEKPVATLVVKKSVRAYRKKIGSDEYFISEPVRTKTGDIFVSEEDLEYLARKRNELLAEEASINYFEELRTDETGTERENLESRVSAKLSGLKNFFSVRPGADLRPKKFIIAFTGAACFIFFFIFGVGFFNRGMQVKNSVMSSGQNAYANLASAQDAILSQNFQQSALNFNEAHSRFSEASEQLTALGGILTEAPGFIPFFSKLSSGSHLVEAGKNISQAGVLASNVLTALSAVKNPLDSGNETVSFLKIFRNTNADAAQIAKLLENARQNLKKVNMENIPEQQRAEFVQLKILLPEIHAFAKEFVENGEIFTDVLGGNGPRKYLFLFQNNQEMRATGGFIGTYGILDISSGRIQKFFIDGIFNPDGQLKEKIVPPEPIQKISAAWSLHDSNWFPDFPASAEEAANFYEKTGGPTVDGVIAMTPTVMQKLLEITGQIDLPEYAITIDKDNFIEKVQQEVEIDHDKELNQPKKILADLTPKVLDKIFNARNFSDIGKTAGILSESLNEKQILIYSRNYEIEKKLSELVWSGEILDAQKDFLSVINTNINGFKSDGVIDEKIEHSAEIQNDGSVVDLVTITRHHNGGNTRFDWWNKVNADYMRVYVPKGSQLLSAEGQTREFNAPPLDYNALGFKRNPKVQMEEDSMKIEEESGTRIYEDAGKTVFANWVYVSPQETVAVKYKYLLPFKINLDGSNNPVDTYSLLAQKQSGSPGSQFVSNISFPGSFKVNWKYPDGVNAEKNALELKTDLRTDKFIGVAFTK